MTTPTRPTRRGITLIEALVAMFVAALGMISLLALFPLGALSMAQALKDSRSFDTAVNGESLMRSHWQTAVVESNSDPFVNAFGPPYPNQPSDPVFVDPIGFQTTTANIANLGPGLNPPPPAPPAGTRFMLTRQNLTVTAGFARAFRFCTLLDDMSYDQGGSPVVSPPPPAPSGFVERAGRYNWSAVLQRPISTNPTVADLTLLVYDGRAAGFTPTNAELSFPNPTLPAGTTLSYAVGGTSLVIPYDTTQPKPVLGRGRWVMLATPGDVVVDPMTMAIVQTLTPTRVSFYRTVSVNDETAGQLVVELQSAIKPFHGNVTNTKVVIFNGLAEVFERPALTPQ